MSDRWTAFTQERLALWRKARDRNVRVHGEACVQALDAFYTAIVECVQRRSARSGHDDRSGHKTGGISLTRSRARAFRRLFSAGRVGGVRLSCVRLP